MFRLLARCAFFLLGLALLADTALPTRTETLQVDQHTSQLGRDPAGTSADTSYTLHLVGGRVASCSVGHQAYGRVRDGDTVDVQATRLLKTCVRIAQGDEVIEQAPYWKWIGLIGGGLLIAVAVGWLKPDEDGAIRIA